MSIPDIAPAQTAAELLDEARVDLGWRVNKQNDRILTARHGESTYTLGHLIIEERGWELYFIEKQSGHNEPIGIPYLSFRMGNRSHHQGDERIKHRYEAVKESLMYRAKVLPFRQP